MRRVAVIRTLMVPVMAWVAGTIGVVAIPESSAPSAAARGGGGRVARGEAAVCHGCDARGRADGRLAE